MPNATETEREEARENLRAYAMVVLRIATRLAIEEYELEIRTKETDAVLLKRGTPPTMKSTSKTFFAYIRVSTAKQGTQGSSLQEQRGAIEAYAQRNGIAIVEWFEERVTAAKRGRSVFARMLKSLEKGDARGIIIHKIDRSARNLRDWADLADLIDRGAEIHFAHDALDLRSRGGRLSADIQAVVAADFIRNLREETRKGFYGRLKQGFYPLRAPVGYLDQGRGQAKAVDPIRGPLVRQAFELYATGDYSFHKLQAELHQRGLRGCKGNIISLNGLTTMLNNPFYVGLIRIRKTGEFFQGAHPSLITKALYDRVQSILRGNRIGTPYKNDFIFRRLIRCSGCGRSLIGERQKGRYIFYRCHTVGCPGACLKESAIDKHIRNQLKPLGFDRGGVGGLKGLGGRTRSRPRRMTGWSARQLAASLSVSATTESSA